MELNQKLAEWAEFEYSHSNRAKNFFTGALGRLVKFWVYPDNDIGELPDFATSLDACVKYLVPKLFEGGYDIYLFSDDGFFFAYMITNDLSHRRCFDSIIGTENPALALCKAIEKLIDSEAKK